MHKSKLVWFMFGVLLTSCSGFFDREIEIDLPSHTSRIVLNSFFGAGDEEIRLLLTHSVGMDDTSSFARIINDPDINLTVNDQRINDWVLEEMTNHYVGKANLKRGDDLKIEVSAPGFEMISGQAKIPEAAEMLSASLGGTAHDFGGADLREVVFRLKDIPGQDNYYRVKFSQEKDGSDYNTGIYLRSPIPWLAQSYDGGLTFSDAAFKDGEIELIIWVDGYYFSEQYEDLENVLVLETLEKTFYDYLTLYQVHHNNQRPDLFGGEPVQMSNHIENGFGLFAGFSKSKIQVNR